MKRLHLSLKVRDLDRSIAFYSGFFGAPPTVRRDDYAKWMLDEPRINFVVNTRPGASGLDHLGIQVDDAEELRATYAMLKEAGGPVHDQGDVVCCYARSTKNWTADPDGNMWEVFQTFGESTVYGTDSAFAAGRP